MERTIYLLRHGRPKLPEGSKICLGHTNVPLSAEGRRQMRQLAPYWLGLGITAVYGSDLARSCDSAALLAKPLGLKPRLRSSLREIDMGQWDGLTFGEIQSRWPQVYAQRGLDIWHYRVPGGESFAQCAERAQKALAAIADDTNGDVLIVAHCGFNRALLWRLGVQPEGGVLAISQDYGALNRLKMGAAGFWRVETVNEQVQSDKEAYL